MLIQSLRNMMKPLMWATLILIIPSFIALYGYQGLRQRRAREAATALTVNGAVVDMDAYRRVYTQQVNREKENRGAHWYEGLEQDLQLADKTIDVLVQAQLLEAKARELGVYVSDKELQETIQQIFGGDKYDERWYRWNLQRAGYDPEQFEESLRWQLAGDKIRDLIQISYHATEPELEQAFRQQRTRFEVEYLSFLVRDFEPEVQIDEEGLTAYFEEHKDTYTVPEKVRLRYLRLSPYEFEKDTRVLKEDTKAYYDANRDRYEIPKRAEVEEILFPTAEFVKDVTPTDEDLEMYLGDRPSTFRIPERRVIQYTYIPIEKGSDSPQIPPSAIREYYEKHLSEYEVKQEQVKAQQILLVLAPNATPDQEETALERILEIRAEIEAGKSFEEAANEYSEDEATREQGGDLGWFSRGGYTVGPEISNAAFTLEAGEISQPFRTPRGYHLLRVTDRQMQRTKPLEEVEADIRKQLAARKLQRLRYEARELGFEKVIKDATLPLVVSDPFDRQEREIDEIVGDDSPSVAAVAFGSATGEARMVDRGRKNYYLVEVTEVLPSREPQLDEVREQVREAYVNSRAKQFAEGSARSALNRIRSQGVPFRDLAQELGKEVRRFGPFQAGDELPEVGEKPDSFIQTVLDLETGQLTTIGGDEGIHLVRLARIEEPRIPDLEAVLKRVEAGVRKEKAPAYTEEIANDILNLLEEKGAALAEAIALASEEYGIPVPSRSLGETEPIGENDPVNVTGWGSNITRAGLRLQEVGDVVKDPIPSRAGGAPAEVSDFFILELLEKIPEHEPELEEVRETVERDYRRHLAAQMAKQKAGEAFEALREAVDAGRFPDESKTIDLVSFARSVGADYAASEQPFSAFPGWGSPFGGKAQPVLKTIYQLQEGELSGVIEVMESVGFGEDKKERVMGYHIVQVTDRQDANMDEFPQAREELLRSVSGLASWHSYPSWLEAAQRSADIVRHESLEKLLAFERGEITEEEYREETE